MNYCKERLGTDKVFEFCNIFCFHAFISCNTNMLHLLSQKCSCLSHCTELWVWGCLPSPGTSVGSEPSWPLLCWPGLLWRVWARLQMGPYFSVSNGGNGGWVLGPAQGSSGEPHAHVLYLSLGWVMQRSFSGTSVCVEGLSNSRADVVGILMDSSELFWTGRVFLCCKFTELRAAFSEDRKWKQKALASHLPLVGGL